MKSIGIFLALTVIFICQAFESKAQSKEVIILIDGVAQEVMMSENGQIEYIIREVPNYLAKYKNANSNYFSSEQENSNYGASSASISGQLNKVFKVIYFLPEEAVLTDATIGKLDDAAEEAIRFNKRIMLQTAYSRSHLNSKLLSDNRIAACKAYLSLKGVDVGMIAEAIEEKTTPSAKVHVFLK